MTGDKTRQKRNGPGGSGCFHAFCYFLARPAQGFARRRLAGAVLVHDSPQNPVPSFPLHQVREPFRRPAGADLVHDSPQNLALSSTGTTSLGLKAPPASRTWCFTPRKPLLFRRRAPRLWDQRRRRRAGRGASLPAIPCSFVHGHHVSRARGAQGEPDVVLYSLQALALSSTGTTSLGIKGRRRAGRGASLPASPYSFVHGHHVFGAGRPPAAPPASGPIIISPRGKELTTNALYLPLRRQF